MLDHDRRIEAVTVAVRKLRPPVPQQLATSGVRIAREPGQLTCGRCSASGPTSGTGVGTCVTRSTCSATRWSRSRRSTRPTRSAARRARSPYLNLVVELDTDLSPRELLAVCHRLEAAAERVRTTVGGGRAPSMSTSCWIDGVTVDEPDLQVPHPRMRQRRFVMAPLGDLAPELVPDGWEEEADGHVIAIGPL